MRVEMSQVINYPVSDVFRFYADDHLKNHPRWDHEMQLSPTTDGEVGIGTVLDRRHTDYGEPVEGSMTVTEFERDHVFGFSIDDGQREFYGRLGFEPVEESATRVSSLVDVPGMPDMADDSILRSITGSWLDNTEVLLSSN